MGSLHPTRDLVFVKDTVSGFIEIAKSEKTLGEEINIATQTEITMGDLAKKLISMINPKAKIISKSDRTRPDRSEVERLLGNNEKIKTITNWVPKFSLDEGLKITVEWFKDQENLKKYKTDIYNV